MQGRGADGAGDGVAALVRRWRHTVAFEQFAPEDENLDFRQQTSFVAMLDTEAEIERPDSVKLFKASRRTGKKRLEIHGSYFVDVSFGDFPYVIRFTPRR